ncbi:MAG: hypothetical protein JKY37_27965 [Nannocystaceae bacterium]|nr:hypothetical protein [Nannocystaceae bacterium]
MPLPATAAFLSTIATLPLIYVGHSGLNRYSQGVMWMGRWDGDDEDD